MFAALFVFLQLLVLITATNSPEFSILTSRHPKTISLTASFVASARMIVIDGLHALTERLYHREISFTIFTCLSEDILRVLACLFVEPPHGIPERSFFYYNI